MHHEAKVAAILGETIGLKLASSASSSGSMREHDYTHNYKNGYKWRILRSVHNNNEKVLIIHIKSWGYHNYWISKWNIKLISIKLAEEEEQNKPEPPDMSAFTTPSQASNTHSCIEASSVVIDTDKQVNWGTNVWADKYVIILCSFALFIPQFVFVTCWNS